MIHRDKAGTAFTFYHYMIDLKSGPCIYKRIAGCGSGTEYLAVTPWGDLYPCHQFVGDEAYKLGNVWDGVTNAYHATGSITGIYEYGCRLFRKRMECAIMMPAAKAGDPPAPLK